MEGRVETKMFDVGDIRPAAYNPRISTPKGRRFLKNSMEQFGYVDPIIVNTRTMHIVGGHQRFEYMKKVGIRKIRAVVVDLPLDEEKAMNVALNKTGEHFEWDVEKLDDITSEIRNDVDLKSLGFDLDEVITDEINHDITQAANDADLSSVTGKPDKTPKAPKPAKGEIRGKYICTTCNKEFTYEEAISGEVREKRSNRSK